MVKQNLRIYGLYRFIRYGNRYSPPRRLDENGSAQFQMCF